MGRSVWKYWLRGLSHLGSIGGVLYQLMGLCHGVGLVDADLEVFVRWVVDAW